MRNFLKSPALPLIVAAFLLPAAPAWAERDPHEAAAAQRIAGEWAFVPEKKPDDQACGPLDQYVRVTPELGGVSVSYVGNFYRAAASITGDRVKLTTGSGGYMTFRVPENRKEMWLIRITTPTGVQQGEHRFIRCPEKKPKKPKKQK